MRIENDDVAICLGERGRGFEPGRPLMPPIVQTSLFEFPTFQDLLDGQSAEHEHHVYSRGQNPTVEAVERALAALERGEACKCFASGMAAISSVFLGLLQAGDHVLFVNQTYGPTLQLASHLERFGITHDVVLDLDVAAVERALQPTTRLIWLESPGTMLFRVLDLEPITRLARERRVLTCLDNSWSTPLLQKPLAKGVDIVVHTASKYLSGHSDVIAGAVITSADRMHEIFSRAFMLNGGILGPFDAWLLMRGLRTLPTRLREHEEAALHVAEFLRGHPAVGAIHHPAIADDHALSDRQLRGYTGVFSFELVQGDFEGVRTVIDGLQRFRIGVSWGGVESIVISPNRGTNTEQLAAQGIPPGLIRLSVGLEGADVLIEDLDRALAPVTA